jgi:hypothetical protein
VNQSRDTPILIDSGSLKTPEVSIRLLCGTAHYFVDEHEVPAAVYRDVIATISAVSLSEAERSMNKIDWDALSARLEGES